MDATERFLNFEIKTIEQVLAITFDGNSLQEKLAFYQEHREALKRVITENLNALFIAATAKVIRIGNVSGQLHWIVAENKRQAIEYFKEKSNCSNEKLNTLELQEINTSTECMLFKQTDVPTAEATTYFKSHENNEYLEVPFVYAIELSLKKGMELPAVIQVT